MLPDGTVRLGQKSDSQAIDFHIHVDLVLERAPWRPKEDILVSEDTGWTVTPSACSAKWTSERIVVVGSL